MFSFYCLNTDWGTPFRKFLNELIVAAFPYGLNIKLPNVFATCHGTKIIVKLGVLIYLYLSKLSLLHIMVVRKF